MEKLSRDILEQHVVDVWLGLTGLVLEVCRRLSVAVDVPIEPLLDGASTFLGFRSFAGFQAGMHYAARAAVLAREFAYARPVKGRSYDKAFIEKLSVALETKGVAALENPPLPPLSVREDGADDDPERVEVLSRVGADLDYELGQLRERILMCFSITDRVISPQAFSHASKLADHLMSDAKTTLGQRTREWVIQALGRARFPEVYLMAGFPHETIDDETWWSRQHFFSQEKPLEQAWAELYGSNGGFAQAGRMRRVLDNQPCAWVDQTWEDSPPAYLALGNALDHAWFELQKGGESYSLCGVAYVPNWGDIPPMLGCSGYMPTSIEAVSLAECEVRGMPPIEGWLRIEWSR